MTRRNFFRSALACFGAMVLAPIRAARGDRGVLVGNWDGRVARWPVVECEFQWVTMDRRKGAMMSPKIEFPPA